MRGTEIVNVERAEIMITDSTPVRLAGAERRAWLTRELSLPIRSNSLQIQTLVQRGVKKRFFSMRSAHASFVALACTVCILGVQGCSQNANALQGPEAKPPTGLAPAGDQSALVTWPSTDPSSDPSGPPLDLLITKSMLYAAGLKYHVNPYLVMGLAWHESGWQSSVVSSAGAVGIMQVMPATAAADGPSLLHRTVNLLDPGDNIDMGTAILKNNLDRYHNDIAKALTAYYAGGAAVADWANLRADCRRYVWAVYNAAIMFKEGHGPA